MKIIITFDPKNDSKETVINQVNMNYANDPGQQTLPPTPKTNTPTERKYYCNNKDCKKEITKDVVAFCLHEDNKPRFNGKVYCRECQEALYGGVPA